MVSFSDSGKGDYFISDHGRLKCPRGYIRVPYKAQSGYGKFSVHGHGHLAHRLVAETFFDKIEGKEFVNHINADKMDCSLQNLEYVDRRGNAIHAVEMGILKTTGVTQYSLSGAFIKSHQSVASASRELGISTSGIFSVLHKQVAIWGYQFRLTMNNATPVTAVNDSCRNRVISQNSLSGHFIRDFAHKTQVAHELGFPKSSFFRSIDKANGVFRGFQFKYETNVAPNELRCNGLKKRKRN